MENKAIQNILTTTSKRDFKISLISSPPARTTNCSLHYDNISLFDDRTFLTSQLVPKTIKQFLLWEMNGLYLFSIVSENQYGGFENVLPC